MVDKLWYQFNEIDLTWSIIITKINDSVAENNYSHYVVAKNSYSHHVVDDNSYSHHIVFE